MIADASTPSGTGRMQIAQVFKQPYVALANYKIASEKLHARNACARATQHLLQKNWAAEMYFDRK